MNHNYTQDRNAEAVAACDNSANLGLQITILILVVIMLILSVVTLWQLRVKFKEVPSLVKRTRDVLDQTTKTANTFWSGFLFPSLQQYVHKKLN